MDIGEQLNNTQSETTDAAVTTDAVEAVEVAAAPQAPLEMDEACACAEEASEDAVEVTDVTDALESIAIALESSLTNGGLAPLDAQFAKLAIDAQFKRLGYTQECLSMESFGGKMTRRDATVATMESVKEALQNAWKVIVALFKRVWTAVSEFMFGAKAKMERLVQRSTQALQAMNDGKAADGSPTLPFGKNGLSAAVTRRLAPLEGKEIEFDEVYNSMKNRVKVLDMIMDDLKQGLETLQQFKVEGPLTPAVEEKFCAEASDIYKHFTAHANREDGHFVVRTAIGPGNEEFVWSAPLPAVQDNDFNRATALKKSHVSTTGPRFLHGEDVVVKRWTAEQCKQAHQLYIEALHKLVGAEGLIRKHKDLAEYRLDDVRLYSEQNFQNVTDIGRRALLTHSMNVNRAAMYRVRSLVECCTALLIVQIASNGGTETIATDKAA